MACLIVAAFDFGTTFSGYAFSFLGKPLAIHANNTWNAGTLLSLKTSTCILLDPEEKFHSFGFEAENKYKLLVENDEHHGWLFFKRFKMLLHNNKKLCRRTTVKDITGKRRMFAVDIFSMSIRYLRDHFLRQLQIQCSGIEESDVTYVITIPAIWDENGKQFMRMAALQADIDNNRLKLALEPEAASIWCQQTTADIEGHLSRPGLQYIVIDIGGGTADITVHERNADGTLTELHKATGGPWGGIYVDDNYLKFLATLFGDKVMSRFKDECVEDYLDMLQDFEINKRLVMSENSPNNAYIICRVPLHLRTISEEVKNKKLKDLIQSSPFSSYVFDKKDKIKINAELARKWFDGPVDDIIQHVENILSYPELHKVSSVLLVGGMAESSYVKEKIGRAFSPRHLIIPNDASLAVLKGAVVFGHAPTSISARVMKYSYGVEVYKRFRADKHDDRHRDEINGIEYCDHVFNVFVNAGDTVTVGQNVSKTSTPIHKESSLYPIYRSPHSKPRYTTEPDTEVVGFLSLQHTRQDTVENRRVEITMIFGETELIVKAREKDTENECITSFDCLFD